MVRKSRKAYIRWSFIYMTVLAVILVIAFFGGINFLQSEMKNELVESHRATSELINSKIAKFSTSTDTAANTISKNRQLTELMQNQSYDKAFYAELMQNSMQLSGTLSITEYIYDYAIYIKNGDKLIHGASLFPAESFFTDYAPEGITEYKKWTELMQEEHFISMYRQDDGDILYLKSIYENGVPSARIIGTLIMEIKGISLENEFAGSIKKNNANVIITQQGRTVYSLYEENDDFYASYTQSGNKSFTKDGIMGFSDQVGALEVIYAVKESNVFKKLAVYEAGVAVAAILLFILGAFLIIYLSKWQYKPIDLLMKRFSGFGTRSYANEFEYINASIDNYEKQQSASSQRMLRYREMALSQAVSRHLEGNISLSSDEIAEKFGYDFESSFHAVVVVYIENVNKELWSGNEQDIRLMHYAIQNVCTELFDEEFNLLTIPVKNEFYVGIVSSEKEESLDLQLRDIYNKVEEVISQLGVEIKVNIGKSFSEFENIRKHYEAVLPNKNAADKSQSADIVKIWEDASDTSDMRNAARRVNEIIEYIKENFSDSNLSMENIAGRVGLNSRYMLKIFKEQTGVLLKDYILKVRIDHAKELLKTDMTIELVAKKCGYTSSHSFIRAFKRACSVTPGEARQSAEK